ncbi:gliding motility-associated C-terminal domain-containing protein [Sphingobacterium nematocida]|uniref:Gliding motility-associated C-terminal domain-containing protein n=2 Tax=Sphingobacterium nematocida TaxID=1513896 RepID=A0A1T5DFD6_9SPHI|nr:gliding motility-associated C-terminal domain-containing protein [Sphingobacterium nematocida]
MRLCAPLFLLFFSFAAMAQRPFITKWKTNSSGEKITIPINSGLTGYNYSVNWGDGTSSAGQTASAEHTYTNAGTYTVSISGNFPAIQLQSEGSVVKDKLVSIEQWGDIQWKSMEAAFSGARNMVLNATDKPNLSTVSSLERMFFGAKAFNSDLSSWDVSGITNMSHMFYDAFGFNGNIDNWNVSNVTNMQGMFWNASAFNRNIGGWNVAKVQDMSFMFYQAIVFNQDLSSWNVSQVTTMNSMFFIALAFDQSLGTWNVSSVTDMEGMLPSTGLSSANYGATLIGWASQPVRTNVKLTATGQTYCAGSAAATARQQLVDKGWVINDAGAVACNGGGGITPGDPGNFITTWRTDNPGVSNINQILIPASGNSFNVYWQDVSNASVNGTITGVSGNVTITFPSVGTYKVEISGDFRQIQFDIGDTDARKLVALNQWGAIQWTSMNNAFNNASEMQYLATDNPNLTNVTDMAYMFGGATIFNGVINSWDVSNVTNMKSMFNGAASFNQDLSGWDVSNVTDMSLMFNSAKAFNQNIGNWNVSSVTNMDGMFLFATVFNRNISAWDVSNVRTMDHMFQRAISFNQPIGAWDVSNVTSMQWMFEDATSFNQDITAWNVSNVNGMRAMFYKATSFNQDISDWNVSNVTMMWNMFNTASSFNQDLGSWDISKVTDMRDFLSNSGLSTTNYDATLIGWANQTNVPQNISLGAVGLKYCQGKTARQSLINTKLWTITDAGEGCVVLNNPPVANDDQVSVTEDMPATGNVLTNDSDPEGNALTASLVIAPVNGTVVLNADGSFAYTPNSNYSGLDSLRYQVCDNGTPSLCDTAWVHFTVAAVNDAPTLAGLPAVVTVREDATEDPFDISSANIQDTDAGSGELTLTLEATGGIFDIATGTGITVTGHLTPRLTLKGNLTNLNHYIHSPSNIYFRPNPNLSGNNVASVKVFINDNGNTGAGGGTDIFIATVKINITPVNDAPVAVDDEVNVTENTPATGNVLTNDSDIDGNALTASLIAAPINGTVVLNANGSFTYTPNNNYSGMDSLFYQVCDNGVPSLCDTAKVRFTVLAVNKAPIDIQLSNSTVAQSVGINGVVGTLSTVDPDIQDTHTYTLVAIGVDNAKFNIFNNNGSWVLRANNSGIMSPQAYTIRIRTTDNNNKFFEKDFTITVVDDIAPVVTSVAVPANGYYREGDPLEFAVNFSEGVMVGGTPYIPITIGSTVRMAQYSTGLGTNQLVFSYTVQAGEVDMDGVALGSAINLNGGTIRDAAQNNAVLALQSIAPTNNVLVNAVRPTVTLSTAMTLVNAPFSVTATFSEAVTGFSLTDITASNATISNLQTANNITYSFLVTPTAGGLVQLSLPENIAVNIAANGNTASNVLNVQYNKMITGISLEDATFVYNGTARSLAVTGTLSTGTTVSYQNNGRTDVGTQEVTATVSGANYQDLVLKANLTISKAEISGVSLANGTYVYSGTARSLVITGTLPSGTTVSYQNNSRTDVGTQEVTATVSGANYQDLVLKANLTISKAEVSGVLLTNGTYVYNGTARSLAITGTLPTGTTVSYQNNSRTDVGTQEVTATVNGANYQDLVLKANLTISKAEIQNITLADGSFVYDGTAKSLLITGTLPQGASVSYTNNGKTDAGIYTVTANINGGTNYNNTALSAKLTIQKANLNHLTLRDAQYVYDGSPKSLQVAGAIPNGLTVIYGNNAKTNAGIYEVTAIIEPSINYEGISLAARLEIKKAAQTITFNAPGVLGRDAGEVPLDVAASSGLPIRLTVDEPLIATVSGVNLQVHRLGTVTVTAMQEGDANHEPAETVSLKIRIAAAADAKLPVRVHKAVSPNGDGINEFLMIEGIGDFSENKVTIFDKSGRVLQEIEGYDNRDRVFTGEYHRDGTYYYYIDVNDGGQWKREKGFFVVKRTVN